MPRSPGSIKVRTHCSDDRQARSASLDVAQQEMKVKKAEPELQDAQQELAAAQGLNYCAY